MKQIFLIILCLIPITVSSQTIVRYWEDLWSRIEKGFDHKNYYDIKGDVKEASITTTYWFRKTKTDSTSEKTDSTDKLLFNDKGYIKTKYSLEKDGSLFLKQENQ